MLCKGSFTKEAVILYPLLLLCPNICLVLFICWKGDFLNPLDLRHSLVVLFEWLLSHWTAHSFSQNSEFKFRDKKIFWWILRIQFFDSTHSQKRYGTRGFEPDCKNRPTLNFTFLIYGSNDFKINKNSFKFSIFFPSISNRNKTSII